MKINVCFQPKMVKYCNVSLINLPKSRLHCRMWMQKLNSLDKNCIYIKTVEPKQQEKALGVGVYIKKVFYLI